VKEEKTILFCSFCGKSQHELFVLITGPTCAICDECVELCAEIVIGERNEKIKPLIEALELTEAHPS